MTRIIIFTNTYLPGFRGGGPIKSTSNLVNLIEDEFDILVCTRNHDSGVDTPYECVLSDQIVEKSRHKVLYLSRYNVFSLVKAICSFKPDVLYVNSFFATATQIILLLNIFFFRLPLVVAPRGELQRNALGIKWFKKSCYLFFYRLLKIQKNITIHSTDNIETKDVKEVLRAHGHQLFMVPNVVEQFSFDALTKDIDELKLIFVSRIVPKKNLHFALEVLKEVRKPIQFDIYGPLEDGAYWRACQDIIETMPRNINVNYRGMLEGSHVVSTMRGYHAFFFPSLSENFGHVIVESMQAGLIPIISDQTPWTGLEKAGVGWDISLENRGDFVFAIEKLAEIDKDVFSSMSSRTMAYIKSKSGSDDLKTRYVKQFKSVALL